MMNRFSKATLSCALLAPWLIGAKADAQTSDKTAQPLPPVTITDELAAVWYNGMRDAAAADLRGSDMIPLGLLGGIEYYTPGYTPVKYRDGKSACGVMLVWSGF